MIRVRIVDESDVVIARRRTRELAAQEGLPEAATEALATAVTEIARNALVHAGGGEVLIAAVAAPRGRGVTVIAVDAGPGIADVDQAMQDGFSTTGSLGFGLPGARRLVDEFAIESTPGAGTRVTLRSWGGSG
jgi:serine/threonine-protein kinase RsbT